MRRIVIAVAATIVLWSSAAGAVATPQQKCDFARITAWKTYRGCIDNALARHAKGLFFDEYAAHARCRHAYFKKWARFQNNQALAGSTCIGDRFVGNGDGTVTDNLTTLVWEKKTNRDGITNYLDPHDADNAYTWGFGGKENGSSFGDFLRRLNHEEAFGGSSGWRLPTLAELETILLGFPCRGSGLAPMCICPSSPCIDTDLDAGSTHAGEYWSVSSADIPFDPFPYAWRLSFADGRIRAEQKTTGTKVRAVRAGL